MTAPLSDTGWRALAAAAILCAILVGVALRVRRSRAAARAADAASRPLADAILVLHASQTGTAKSLAHDTGELLRQAGRAVQVRSLGTVTNVDALAHRHVLLLVATCGDGEPPDEAQPFVQQMLRSGIARQASLAGISFGLLALGNQRYSDFCGFGRAVDRWLKKRDARPLFERIEVDGYDPEQLVRWRAALRPFIGAADPAAWRDAAASPRRPWRIAARRVLNAGSVGEPMLHVELEPADGQPLPDWEAGDLARVVVPASPWARDYSIASVPRDRRLHLVVRRIRRGNGHAGVASGWLADAPLGAELSAELVAHPSFRIGDNADRPLVLVGNGAGIAGLRGHLRARADRPGARHWLVFGERQRAHDVHFDDEIARWQADGTLERVDLALSRDEPDRPYVQDRLREAAEPLRRWVADGAAIYVCGSRKGMAERVHEALIDVLGGHVLEELAAAGRYRRDVY